MGLLRNLEIVGEFVTKGEKVIKDLIFMVFSPAQVISFYLKFDKGPFPLYLFL